MQMNLRPKVRKMSTYDLGMSDPSIHTGSFESQVTPEGQAEELEDPEPPPCLHGAFHWVTGDTQYLTDFLERWPLLSPVLPLRLLNAILRTLGAPLLANNPFSGALVLAALLIEAPLVVIWGTGALLVAFLTALLLRQPQHIVSSGQVTQHGLLLGLLVGHAMHSRLPGNGLVSGAARQGSGLAGVTASALLLGVLAAVSSVPSVSYPNSALSLTMPYVLIGTPLCASLGFRDVAEPTGVPDVTALPSAAAPVVSVPATPVLVDGLVNVTVRPTSQHLQWTLVLQGVVRGAGQVYGCEGLVSSGLVFAATLVFSPTVFGQALLGTLTGALCGTLLDEPPYTALYAGQYGRHSLLTALSLGGFFFVLNTYSTLAGVFGGVLATLLFHALRKSPLAVLTTPHVISTLIFLHARLRGGLLKRVDLIYLSFPEMHRRLFRPGNAVEDFVLA
ncbi:urea transporter 1-like [Scylla paramamosain]|uniref:urea transporter 1-like n=1 Tax=Scylla paramamosain TaxID=85552 RepID=UPI003083C4C9